MARTHRRLRVYLLILLVAILIAILVPYFIRAFSDYLRKGPIYYYPHDLERDRYMNGKERG